MITAIDTVLLSSPDAKKVAAFYRDVVGIAVEFEGVMGEHDEEIYSFKLKGSGFTIMDHSGVHGLSKDPNRMMINFEVDDIKKEVARLKKAKVKVLADTYHIEEYGYVATFADVDGNLFQLVQVRAK